MSTITVHHRWPPSMFRRWHWYVETPGHRIRHGYAPWRWLAVAAARHSAARRDRAWARHLSAHEVREVTR